MSEPCCASPYLISKSYLSGFWLQHHDESGRIEHTDDGNVKYTTPKTAQCQNCGKRVPYPKEAHHE